MTLGPSLSGPTFSEKEIKQVCPMGAFFPPTVHELTHTVTILRLTIFVSWCFLPDHKELPSSSFSSMAFLVWTACWWALPALRLRLFHTGYCERLVHVKFSTRKECLHLLPSGGVAGCKGVTLTLWLLGWILGCISSSPRCRHQPALSFHPGSVWDAPSCRLLFLLSRALPAAAAVFTGLCFWF